MKQLPYLNLACGTTHFPSTPHPDHEGLIPDNVYWYPDWLNVDRNAGDNVDQVVDLFTYPWALADNSFDGAIAGHIIEHIPHEIKLDAFITERSLELREMQDGWFAFFSELYRVLSPGAVVYIVSPYGRSQMAMADPTHTRFIVEQSFGYLAAADPNAPYRYKRGAMHYEARHIQFSVFPDFQKLLPKQGDSPEAIARKDKAFSRAVMTRTNVVNNIMIALEAIK